MLDDSNGVVNGKFNGIPIEDSLEYGRLRKDEYKKYNLDAEQKWKKLTVRLAEEISHGYTMARLANEIGYKAIAIHTWAQVFKEREVGDAWSDVFQLENAIESRFNELDKERIIVKSKFPARVETSVTKTIMKAIKTAREEQEIVDICAPSGSGKSQAVAEYVAQVRKAEGFNSPVWVVELTAFALSTKSILEMIATACVSQNFEVSNDLRADRTIREATEGRGGVLIIEEAQHLGDLKNINGIHVFNGLRRYTDAGCFGIALIGNGELYDTLKKGKRSAQLISRMEAFREVIPGVVDDDVDRIMEAWGVVGKAERTACLKIAKSPGALRSLVGVFKRSLREYGVINLATINAAPKG
ncbi:AAA family ATPase [Undibacterium flavidum]|uniref:AAA family ATPase n=1 Tax=Undibacterium flavidum TaxID=2762297 RepID=A0ABR6Y736_9BURK|nr:AAA family ATPase [Undibacterium flavidum]MBC3872412.1 AAA family ATPase [Undibacterium flavidum]